MLWFVTCILIERITCIEFQLNCLALEGKDNLDVVGTRSMNCDLGLDLGPNGEDVNC